MANADLGLVVNAHDEGSSVDPRGQFSPLEQLRKDGNIGVFGIHVLHTGDAE